MTTLSTKDFTYDARTKTFSTERSDIQEIIENSYIPSTQLRGVGLKSHKTGSEITFKYLRGQYDDEGELQYTTYQSLLSIDGDHYKLIIYND